MARGFRAGGAGGFGGGIKSITIPYLENGLDTNSGQGTGAGNRGYSAQLNIDTTNFTTLSIGSFTGSTYGTSSLELSVTGSVSGSLFTTHSFFNTEQTIDITNENTVTIKIRDAYQANNAAYTQRANNIVFS